tara:strand:- start:9754 stop:10602 length:849 start_codon:yes stop_codon:yes gene_type:complete
MIKKIIIGTSNFGTRYGIEKKIVSEKKAKELIKYAIKKKIFYLDTAKNYKTSNKFIQKMNNKLIVNSKILPNFRWTKLNVCINEINKIKKNINYKTIDTIYLHDEKIIRKKIFPKIYDNLLILKKRKFFKKLGISIYNFDTIDFFLNKYYFKVVQCPFNIFDQRLSKKNYIKKLRSKNIEIHVRSIFLQGLLNNRAINKINLSNKLKKNIIKLQNFADHKKVKVLDLCVTFVSKFKVDRFVVGFNNINNFKEVIKYKKIKSINFNKFSITNKKIIDPRYWNK